MLHARLRIGDAVLMGADIPNAEPMRSAYLTLRVDRAAEAERIYAALSEGGRILMPIAETLYASRFAQVQDQFGLNWILMCERPQPQP